MLPALLDQWRQELGSNGLRALCWRGMGKEVLRDLVRVTHALRNGSARNIFN